MPMFLVNVYEPTLLLWFIINLIYCFKNAIFHSPTNYHHHFIISGHNRVLEVWCGKIRKRLFGQLLEFPCAVLQLRRRVLHSPRLRLLPPRLHLPKHREMFQCYYLRHSIAWFGIFGWCMCFFFYFVDLGLLFVIAVLLLISICIMIAFCMFNNIYLFLLRI
jgi:hypothetical protein